MLDEVTAVCRRCNYDHDKQFWNSLAERFAAKQCNGYPKFLQAIAGKQVLTIDTLDIDALVERLQEDSTTYKFPPLAYENPSENDVCDFRMPADKQIKVLEDCNRAYRNFDYA